MKGYCIRCDRDNLNLLPSTGNCHRCRDEEILTAEDYISQGDDMSIVSESIIWVRNINNIIKVNNEVERLNPDDDWYEEDDL